MCVLVVEDEALTRELVAESLQKAGFEVEAAETGEEAVGLILDHPDRFEALVTDLQMPGCLDGSEVAAAMRQQLPDIPVVIASGHPELFQESWHHELGYELVSKPFRASKLIALVRQLTQACGRITSVVAYVSTPVCHTSATADEANCQLSCHEMLGSGP